MGEQSDTPETDAAEREDAGPITHAIRGWNYARKHERERDEARISVAMLWAAAKLAESALADIGDSDHEPTDDLAWCELRAQRTLPVVRFALAATEPNP